MLSILIPAFRTSALSTVKQVLAQTHTLDVEWEVIVSDDGSGKFETHRREISALDGVSYVDCQNPRSRAATRNELAERASYPYSLFIDGSVGITDLHYLENYLKARDTADVLSGGVQYPEDVAEEFLLDMKYQRAHQENHGSVISLSNFMISTWLFNQVRFDEERDFFGHTERLFTRLLEERKIDIKHIHNPVMPMAFEPKETFLHEIFEGTEQAWELVQQGKISRRDIPLIDEYYKMKETSLGRTTLRSYSLGQKALWLKFKSAKAPIKTVDRILWLRMSELDEDFKATEKV